MEESVRNAMQSLTSGDDRLDPHRVLKLQEQLSQVDLLFSNLRKEVLRLNSLLAEQKDANDALREHNRILVSEVKSLKSPKTNKKSTASKKNLTRKSK